MKRMWSRKELQQIASLMAIAQMQSGNVSDVKVFENIVDKDGHQRFIDFEASNQYEMEGLTFSYMKASLSGSHLLLVVCGTFTNGTVSPVNVDLVRFKFPDWINNKIVPVWGDFIEAKTVAMYNADWTTQSQGISLRKKTDGLTIYTIGTTTMSKDRNFRFTFDLLIDND